MNQIANNIKRMLQAESDKGKNIDWYRELLFTNPTHPFLKQQYEACPLLFESTTDTERQLLAVLGDLGRVSQFPNLQARAKLAASDIGVIPSIRSHHLSNIDRWHTNNISLIHDSLKADLGNATKSTHAQLYEFMRPNISQHDYGYIANNARALGLMAEALTENLRHNSFVEFRDPILAPSLFYDRVISKIQTREPVDRTFAMSPGGMGAIDSIGSVTNLPAWGEPHMWVEFSAYAEYRLPWEDTRLILAPRHIPWQLLLTTNEGFMVPFMAPVPIPLLEDVVWACKWMPADDSPSKLPIPDENMLNYVIPRAQDLAILAAIYSALASLKKIGRGNTRMRWINSPYNARLMSHIIKAIA